VSDGGGRRCHRPGSIASIDRRRQHAVLVSESSTLTYLRLLLGWATGLDLSSNGRSCLFADVCLLIIASRATEIGLCVIEVK